MTRLALVAGLGALLAVAGCTNNPYPDDDRARRSSIRRSSSRPRRSTPRSPTRRRSTSSPATSIETLLEYHYLKPSLPADPRAGRGRARAAGAAGRRAAYRFRLRRGVLFQDDPCFRARRRRGGDARDHRRRRRLRAARIADPTVNSPVASRFAKLRGFRRVRGRLAELREPIRPSPRCRAREQYRGPAASRACRARRPRARDRAERALSADPLLVRDAVHDAGAVGGGRVLRRQGRAAPTSTSTRSAPGRSGSPATTSSAHRARAQRELVRRAAPGRHAPGAVFPTEGDPATAAGRSTRRRGAPLPVPRSRRVRAREGGHPALQQVPAGLLRRVAASSRRASTPSIHDDRLSPEMEARGMRLDKEVEPDDLLHRLQHERSGGRRAGGDSARKLRQAMSLVDRRRGVLQRLSATAAACRRNRRCRRASSATTRSYRNPYRSPTSSARGSCSPRRAIRTASIRRPSAPLHLTFDTGDTTRAGALQYQFFVDAWRRARARRRDRRHHLQPVPGQGRARRLPDLPVGLDRRLPRPGELPVPALVQRCAAPRAGPNTANFCEPALRRAVPRHEGHRRTASAAPR